MSIMDGADHRTATSGPGVGGAKEREVGEGSARSATPRPSPWRTETQQKTYSSKLIEALRRVRGPGARPELPRSRAVREAADRALAVAARGRTLWSRSILSSRAILLKARKRRPSAAAGRLRKGAAPPMERRSTLAIRRKARVLGRLVPGCRKLPFSALLKEASDYIAALEMQVRAMTALASSLSAGGSASPATGQPGSSQPS